MNPIPAPQPLTYPSINPVFQYFPFEKRLELAKRVPALRRANKTLPYLFDTVKLISSRAISNPNSYFTLDSLKWSINKGDGTICEHRGRATRSNDVQRDMDALIGYYLRRVNTRVKQFFIEEFSISPGTINISRIEFLQGYWAIRTQIELVQFRNTSIGQMDVAVLTNPVLWIRAIANLLCKKLKVKSYSNLDSDVNFAQLPFEKLEIEVPFISLEQFEQMCRPFLNENMEIGCKFSGGYPGVGFWDRIDRSFPVKTSGENFFTTETVDPNTELLVERYEEHGLFKCRAEVVKAGTGMWRKVSELPMRFRKKKEALRHWWWRRWYDGNRIEREYPFLQLLPQILTGLFNGTGILSIVVLIYCRSLLSTIPVVSHFLALALNHILFEYLSVMFVFPVFDRNANRREKTKNIVICFVFLAIFLVYYMVFVSYIQSGLILLEPVIIRYFERQRRFSQQEELLTDKLKSLFQTFNGLRPRSNSCKLPNPFEPFKVMEPTSKSFKDYLSSYAAPPWQKKMYLNEDQWKKIGKLLFNNLDTLLAMGKTDNFWE